MRVICVSENLSPSQIEDLGPEFLRRQEFGITTGREYVVLGLHFHVRARHRGTGAWVELKDDMDSISWAPLVLFRIIDARPSRHWRINVDGANVHLDLPQFERPHFHEDVADRDPEALRIRDEFCGLLDDEYPGTPTSS